MFKVFIIHMYVPTYMYVHYIIYNLKYSLYYIYVYHNYLISTNYIILLCHVLRCFVTKKDRKFVFWKINLALCIFRLCIQFYRHKVSASQPRSNDTIRFLFEKRFPHVFQRNSYLLISMQIRVFREVTFSKRKFPYFIRSRLYQSLHM